MRGGELVPERAALHRREHSQADPSQGCEEHGGERKLEGVREFLEQVVRYLPIRVIGAPQLSWARSLRYPRYWSGKGLSGPARPDPSMVSALARSPAMPWNRVAGQGLHEDEGNEGDAQEEWG